MSDSLAHETTDVEKAKASIENMDDEEQKQKILSTNITKIPIDNKKDKKLQKDNDDTVEMLVSESRESVETFSNRESEVKQRETKLPTSTEKHDSDTENIIRESVQSEIAQSEAPECLEDSVDTRKDPISKAQSSAQALPGIFSNKEIQTTESETEDRTSAAKQNSGTENTIRESLQSVEVSSKPQSFKKVTSEAPQFLEVSVDTQKDTISREQYFTQASPETFSNKQIEMTERETEDTASTAKQDSDTENTTLESVPSAVVSSKPQSFEVAQSEALQSLEVLVDADKDTITKDQSYIQPLPETFSNKESEITERETEFTSTAKQDSNTENITAENEQSAVVSSKPQAFEKAQSEASQSLVEVSVDAEKDTLCTQALPQISKPIKSTDVASSEDQSSETSTASTVPSTDVDYADHVTYKEDGSAIYTDPKTKYQYKWCAETNNWTPCEAPTESSSTTSDPFENEHYKWCQKTQKWIPKQTQVTETEHYKWDADKKQWIPKMKKEATQAKSSEIVYDIDEEGQRTYTDNDGTVFFWDVNKNAWFPKIDEDFMARYQMSYGFIDNTSEAEKEKEEQELNEVKRKQVELQRLTEEAKTNDEASKGSAEGVKRKAQQEPPQWFEMDPSRNTKVYISNLPLDITLDEFAELMGKCGMIMRDPLNQKFKLKLYTEADGQIKGDGLCDYIKVESVDLALKILDEYYLRGNKIRVQRAQFQMRGEYNPALKPKRKKKDKEKLAKIKEKLFDWRPEKMRGERSKHEKTVIIKNLFHPELFEKEVPLILDYQNDLREECSKCGTVKKVVIYDRHSEGVAQINMTSPEEADLVIQMMQGRFFGKRQLTAEHWDGKTKYKIDETEEEIKKRLNKWDQYLERTEAAEATKRTSD